MAKQVPFSRQIHHFGLNTVEKTLAEYVPKSNITTRLIECSSKAEYVILLPGRKMMESITGMRVKKTRIKKMLISVARIRSS